MIEALILKYGYDKFKQFCRFAAIGFGIVASIIGFAWNQQTKGAAKATAKIEKQDTANVNKANTVGAKSRDPRSWGVLDPNVRNDN